jgi:plastocyanin
MKLASTPYVVAFLALIGIAVLGVACGDSGTESRASLTRTFYLEAIEPKGTTNVAKEPFPSEALPEGGGYGLKEPNADGDWVVETYVWNPKQIVVTEGDTVNLEILGVNGSTHQGAIEGYVEDFVVERGKLTRLSFTADKAGVFKMICTTHHPAMTGELVVLPKS